MSRRLADATSRFLARKSPRRGFLAKSAVVGSALAVAPTQYLTRPGTAYAQVCNCSGSSCTCGSLCCDGYTEFCCTIYGTNGCPPGSLYGGWWRVSGSNYCGGSNRYYLDCHNPCGDCGCGASGICSGSCNGTRCGCGLGSCSNRKAGCTHFRYGQCNQQVSCLGPIICRVVTCTPPWELEPNCTRSIRTDEATRNHNRACLQETGSSPTGGLDRVRGREGTIRVRGWALDPDQVEPIDVAVYVNGDLVATALADRNRPDVGAAYGSFGPDHGFDITFASTLGTKEVCVYALNAAGGSNKLLGCEQVRVTSATPTGLIETADATDGGVVVRGWALVDGSRDPLDVDIRVGDTLASTVTADQRRRDMASTFGDAGLRHGFETRIEVAAGTHEICASVIDPETGSTVSLGCTTVSVDTSPAPIGALDSALGGSDGIEVTGWVLDPDGDVAGVTVVVNGVEVARSAATVDRPDIAAAHTTNGQLTGFEVQVGAEPGDHSVCVYSLGSDDAPGPLLGCADVVVG